MTGELADAGVLGWTAGAVVRGDAAMAIRGHRARRRDGGDAPDADQGDAAALGGVLGALGDQARTSHWMVMRKAQDARLPFAISARQESGVLRRYRQHVALGLLGLVGWGLLAAVALWSYRG